MKKALISITLMFLSFFALPFAAMAEEADTDIRMDTQTILEKDYENKGITGLYDIEMFQEEESLFTIYKHNKEDHYEKLKSDLFKGDIHLSKEISIQDRTQELGIFSEVNYHIGTKKSTSQEDSVFYIIGALIFTGFSATGVFASLIYIHIRRSKEGKYVYHYNNENQ